MSCDWSISQAVTQPAKPKAGGCWARLAFCVVRIQERPNDKGIRAGPSEVQRNFVLASPCGPWGPAVSLLAPTNLLPLAFCNKTTCHSLHSHSFEPLRVHLSLHRHSTLFASRIFCPLPQLASLPSWPREKGKWSLGSQPSAEKGRRRLATKRKEEKKNTTDQNHSLNSFRFVFQGIFDDPFVLSSFRLWLQRPIWQVP